jgi:type I restriction enzyme, S subunit
MAKDDKRTLMPRLRFPEFRKGKAWEERQAGELFTNRVEHGEDGLPIYSVTIDDGMVMRASLERRVDDIADSEGNKRACRNDIAYNMMRMWQGAFGVAVEDCMVSPAYVVLTPREGVFSDFFGKLLKTPWSLRSLTSHSHGLTKDRLRLYYKDFARIPLPLPSLAEQQKIADCLTSLDELIAAQGRKVEALTAHRKGLMQQLFPREGETTPRLRFPEFRDKGEWHTTALGELLVGKPEYGVNAAAVPFSDSLPAYLRITDIDDDSRYIPTGKVSADIDATEENYLSDGDIALARTGASVGKSYRCRQEDGRLVFAGFLIRIRPDTRKVVSTLLSNFLTTQQYWDWVRVTSARSGQPGINGTEYATLLVPIPPPSAGKDELAEQQRIADCLSALDARIVAEADRLAALKTHKKGLMQQLFPSPEGG